VIRRRHVIYVEGYDPQGAEGYYAMFQRTWQRALPLWSATGTLGPLQIDSEEFAHWDVDASGPNWHVTTRYDFLRQEQIIRANMAEPLPKLLYRSILWSLRYWLNGSNFRMTFGSWRYGTSLVFFQLMAQLWVLFGVLCGGLAATALVHFAGWPIVLAALVGLAVGVGAILLLRPAANRWYVVQINSHWPHVVEFARGEKSCFDAPVEACARRLVEVVRANEADEVLLMGHSGGCMLVPVILARALELDPDLGRHGPRVVMLTVGSIMPAAGVHRGAIRLRAGLARVAVEPSVLWIDGQAHKDILNYPNYDPIKGLRIDVRAERCNPLIWEIRFRDMLTAATLRRLRWEYFRLHYQFLMANELRAPYDFFMLVAGPVPVEDWARHGRRCERAFAPDGTYTETPARAQQPATAAQRGGV
jgi:hypothetical protein